MPSSCPHDDPRSPLPSSRDCPLAASSFVPHDVVNRPRRLVLHASCLPLSVALPHPRPPLVSRPSPPQYTSRVCSVCAEAGGGLDAALGRALGADPRAHVLMVRDPNTLRMEPAPPQVQHSECTTSAGIHLPSRPPQTLSDLPQLHTLARPPNSPARAGIAAQVDGALLLGLSADAVQVLAWLAHHAHLAVGALTLLGAALVGRGRRTSCSIMTPAASPNPTSTTQGACTISPNRVRMGCANAAAAAPSAYPPPALRLPPPVPTSS